jgi:hypothetical protein
MGEEDENMKKMRNIIENINIDDIVSIKIIANSLLESISRTTQMLEESTQRHLKQVISPPKP